MPDVSIIGTGALGSTLARALRQHDVRIKSLFNRNPRSCQIPGLEDEAETAGEFPRSAEDLAPLIFLTVPDSAIREVAEKLTALQDDWSGYTMVHCSGSESSAILSSLGDLGARTASFHPIQTFTSMSDPSDFEGISFDMEGDREALDLLREVAGRLGAKTFEVTPEAKGYLHASAVVASNYMVALLHASEQIAGLGGLDPGTVRHAMLPLMRQSLENAAVGNLSEALSGPVARGDAETVARHLKLLNGNSDLLSLYRQLGRQALNLAKQKGTLTTQQISELEHILKP